jgi:SpoVK/Ycf46/Vps4 family AAA+-type ATPase
MGEVSLAEIARKTIGYLPRHLKALCTHAAGAAIRRQALGKTLSGRHGVGRTAQEASYLQWPYLQSPHPDATLPLPRRLLIGALDFEEALTQVHCCCLCVGEVQSLLVCW